MSTLEAIQEWYQRQCDGEWEHHYGIKIETLDNPGWLVKVDLTKTVLLNRHYEPINESVDIAGWPQGDRWIQCFVRESVWHGAGDETKLGRILLEFVNWASRS